jgi:hypothetical protein
MPNPAVQPAPIVSPPHTLVVRSTVQCAASQHTTIQNIVGPGTVMNEAAIRGAIQAAHDNVFPDLTDDTMPPVKELLVSTRIGGRLLGRYWYNTAFGSADPVIQGDSSPGADRARCVVTL